MLTLYYSKGSSPLAAHILLEEVGVPYVAQEVSIAQRAHTEDAFLAINPKGRVPALGTPDGVITENPAILEYIAEAHPEAGFMPASAIERAQARSLCSYLCATVHVAFAHLKRGARWADDDAAIASMQARVAANLAECATFLEGRMNGDWAMGDRYSYCDPYLFLIGGWFAGAGQTLDRYPALLRHADAMRARPATRRALAVHGLA